MEIKLNLRDGKVKKIYEWEPWFFMFFGLFHLHRIWGLIDRTSYTDFWIGILESKGIFYFVLMVILVMIFKINVGLVSFAVAAVLSFLKVSDEGEALKRIPWGTLLLITGVGVLMQLIIGQGGIKMLSAALVSVMNESTAVSIMGICSGLLSWFSSTSGVVMPTLIPTIPHIVAQMGGAVSELEP